ncbi:MAG TPA: GTPase domain-containing protein [Ktedonobacteraceae bacterium]|nr:GTPase domain-containing protein [Ktedonobacteraceae bacterium]
MAEATVVELGFSVVAKVGPAGIRRGMQWLLGKVILVVGPPRSGKTTFINYLCLQQFQRQHDTDVTTRFEDSGKFDIKMGRDDMLRVSVKKVVDFPGDIGAVAHAEEVFKRRPHAIIIFTDLAVPAEEDPNGAAVWLAKFCSHLESLWRRNGSIRGNRTKAVLVVMNKHDKITDEQVLIDRKRQLRTILHDELRQARGRMRREIAILPCTLVKNAEGHDEVDNVVTSLVKGLAKW